MRKTLGQGTGLGSFLPDATPLMPSKRLRTYFTLVELLVVIAVIAILAAPLLPALSKAKQTVLRISCTNNLRNIHQTTFLYVNDNDSWLPPAVYGYFAAYYLNDYLRKECLNTYDYPWNGYTWTKVITFGKPSGVYFCPELDRATKSTRYTGPNEPSEYSSSYQATLQNLGSRRGCWAFQDNSTSPATINISRKIELINGNCVLVCDRTYEGNSAGSYTIWAFPGSHTASAQYASFYPQYAPAFVHQGQTCNFLFKDGHVTPYRYTGIQLFDDDYVPVE